MFRVGALLLIPTPCSNRSAAGIATLAAAAAFLPARFVEYAEDRSTRESQRFWFSVMDADGDGRLSWADMKLLYDAVEQSCNAGILLHFEDLMNQIRDMVAQQHNPADGFTAQELWDSKLGAGVIGLLTNANNMLLQRSTAEWGRGEAGWHPGYTSDLIASVDLAMHRTHDGYQPTAGGCIAHGYTSCLVGLTLSPVTCGGEARSPFRAAKLVQGPCGNF